MINKQHQRNMEQDTSNVIAKNILPYITYFQAVKLASFAISTTKINFWVLSCPIP